MEGDEEAEALAAEGMTQLAASRSAPASSSFGNVADISPLVALARSLIQISSQIPPQVGASLCLMTLAPCPLQQMYLHAPTAASLSILADEGRFPSYYVMQSSATPASDKYERQVLGSEAKL